MNNVIKEALINYLVKLVVTGQVQPTQRAVCQKFTQAEGLVLTLTDIEDIMSAVMNRVVLDAA